MSKLSITSDSKTIPGDFPSVTRKLNPRWVIEQIAAFGYVALIVAFALATLLGAKIDVIWLLASEVTVLLAIAAVRDEPKRYRFIQAPAEPRRPERVFSKEEVAEIGGKALADLRQQGRIAPAMSALVGEPVYFAEDVDNDRVRSFAEPTSYPIPASIAAALGPKAAAQIAKDTEAHQ